MEQTPSSTMPTLLTPEFFFRYMNSKVKAWSDLIPELLELVVNNLKHEDRLSSSRVCRRWSEIVNEVPPSKGLSHDLPCFLSTSNDCKACTLVDPFDNEMHIKCPNLPSEFVILCSKDGWLLVQSGQSIVFFNPMTKARIDLPDINFSFPTLKPLEDHVFAFTSPPTSPDCLVIDIFRECHSNGIYLCRRGHTEWTRVALDFEEEFEISNVSPVFYEGSLYYLGVDGRLGVYDPTENVWSVFPNPEPMTELQSNTKDIFLVEADGELLMVSTDNIGESVHIFKLDPSASQWTEIYSIGDRSLFVSRFSSVCSKADVLTGNKIYFPRIKDGAYMFYSCEERKFHPSGNFDGSRVFPLSMWIEPAWFQPSSPKEQLLLKWTE